MGQPDTYYHKKTKKQKRLTKPGGRNYWVSALLSISLPMKRVTNKNEGCREANCPRVKPSVCSTELN